MTRKDFIVDAGRIFLLMLMLSGAGYLIGKRRVSLGGNCEDNAGCKVCRLNTICRDIQKQTSETDGKQRV